MAAIFKLETVRQARRAPKGDPDGSSVSAQQAEAARREATILLFTGVRYERLPDAKPRRRARDVLDLVD